MYSAKVIQDSISRHTGKRITTFELEYPRFIHCFDEETEILSQINEEPPQFRSFKAIRELDCKVAQYEPEGEQISFVYPENIIENTGNHHMIKFEKKKLSMYVTDKHRVYTLKRTTNNNFVPDVILAEELLADYGTRRIPQAGYMNQTQFYSNDELALIVWYVADGHKENNNVSSFHFRKNRKVRRVCELLTNLNIDYKTFEYNNDFVIRFNNPHWVDYCYDDNGNKKIPNKATFMTQDGYDCFKQALLESDGNVENQDYNTSSKTLAEQIQIIALLHNDVMNIRSYNGLYKQKFQQTNYLSLRHDKDSFESENMEGTVYCVTVQSSFVIVRRNGISYVSGNCEFMTHRLFSRNAASSRAIPSKKLRQHVRKFTAKPLLWLKNQKGMSASEDLSPIRVALAHRLWMTAAYAASITSWGLEKVGLHKQWANRVLEPFQFIKVVVTATEWDNFFYLRIHPDAQPEIRHLASLMYNARENSVPWELSHGEWHLPYIDRIRSVEDDSVVYGFHDDIIGFEPIDLEVAKKISASCCAQVSYRVLSTDPKKAESIFNKLIESKPVHASPVEHQATPMNPDRKTGEGVTHKNILTNEYWSGNFCGWIQHRQLINDHTCWDCEGKIENG